MKLKNQKHTCTSFIIRNCFLHLFPHVDGLLHQTNELGHWSSLRFCLPEIPLIRKKYKAHHVYSLCVPMYVSFPLDGFDSSDSAIHYAHTYLKSYETNQSWLEYIWWESTAIEALYWLSNQPLRRLFCGWFTECTLVGKIIREERESSETGLEKGIPENGSLFMCSINNKIVIINTLRTNWR